MKTISVCMIVKDESQTLNRVLSLAKKIADEIIVVDTGSKDNTKQIALQYTNKVFDFKWQDDFSLARNFSFSKSTSDYTMWLDADDVIEDGDIKRLLQLKTKLTDQDVIMLPYEIAFDQNGKATFSYYRERILKTGKFLWTDPIHEVIVPAGKIEYCNIPIKHKKVKANTNPKRNLNIYRKLIKDGVKLSARQQFYYANELYYNKLYKSAIREYKKFLSMNGYIENRLQAYLNLARIYHIQNNLTLARKTLFESFCLDLPRSEILCELGYNFFISREFRKAIYWYNLAIQKVDLSRGGFVEKEMYDYVPLLQMSVCNYYLGNIKKAQELNSQALKLKPNDPIALKNDIFYKNLLKS